MLKDRNRRLADVRPHDRRIRPCLRRLPRGIATICIRTGRMEVKM